MIRKRKKMIIFAVFAVIIVAVPIALYEGQIIYNLPPVTVNSRLSDASYTWKYNFTSNYQPIAPVLNTTNIISDNGHVNSSFSFSLWTASLYASARGPSVFNTFELLISGNFTSNLHPSSISVTTNETAPPQVINISRWLFRQDDPRPEYSKDWANVTLPGSSLCIFEKNDSYGNVTFTGSSPGRFSRECSNSTLNLTNDFKLTNDTGLGKNTTYHFSFLTQVDYCIFNTILISPFYLYQPYTVHFIVSLKGLSKPVTDRISMTLVDIPS